MMHPTARLALDRERFVELGSKHSIVPVWAEVLGDLETPVSAFLKLVGDAPGFLLESVEQGQRWGRYSFVGYRPTATMTLRDGALNFQGALLHGVPEHDGILAALDALIATMDAPSMPELPPMHGGVMGFLGYDVVREVEHLPNAPVNDHGLPDAVMSVIGSVAAFDHWLQRIYLIESVPTGGRSSADLSREYDRAGERVAAAVGKLAEPLPYVAVEPPRRDEPLPPLQSSMPDGAYQRAVEVAKERVLDGDIFQVVLSQRFDVELEADPFDVYRVLRQINPSPYMYFLRDPNVTIAGSSPEPLVTLDGATVVSRPIAGTRKRGESEQHDRRLAAELVENPKERAEHVMLVDLARNDVGRVSKFGTVAPDELMVLERYSHVMHLTSQVSGEIRDDVGPIDVLKATMPAGTLSGAPKVRAMEIIDELEPFRRAPYGGAVGYIDWSGNLDMAILIRTMFVRPPNTAGKTIASLQAGAGIVADSDPDDEHLECQNKAAALAAALEPARRMTEQHRHLVT